jgi:hypothetical protein
MDAAIAVAVITGALTALGWLVNYALAGRREREARAIGALLAHTERQLERLYGPLEFQMIEGRQVFQDLLEDLGRGWVFPLDERLEGDELRRWHFFLEHSGLPGNERIRELLAENTHLIEGDRMPASYQAFLEHYSSWKLEHLRWEKEGAEYRWHSRVNWPIEFERDVHETFESLMERHAALRGKVRRL